MEFPQIAFSTLSQNFFAWCERRNVQEIFSPAWKSKCKALIRKKWEKEYFSIIRGDLRFTTKRKQRLFFAIKNLVNRLLLQTQSRLIVSTSNKLEAFRLNQKYESKEYYTINENCSGVSNLFEKISSFEEAEEEKIFNSKCLEENIIFL